MLMFGIQRRSTRLVGHRGQEALEDLADEFEQVELGLDVLAQEKVLAVREEGLLDALGRHEELWGLLHYWNLRQKFLNGEADDCEHRRAPVRQFLLEHALSSFWRALVGQQPQRVEAQIARGAFLPLARAAFQPPDPNTLPIRSQEQGHAPVARRHLAEAAVE